MRTRNAIVIGIIALIIGVVMLFCNNMFGSHAIVMAGGILLLGTGLINFLATTLVTDDQGRRKTRGAAYIYAMLISLVAVGVGIWVLCNPAQWIPYIPLLFGVLTAMGAIILFYEIIRGIRPAKAPGWLYIPATLTAVAATANFFLQTPSQDNVMFIVTGVAFVLFGISMIVCGTLTGSFNIHQRREAHAAAKGAEERTEKPAEKPAEKTADKDTDKPLEPLEANDKDTHDAE